MNEQQRGELLGRIDAKVDALTSSLAKIELAVFGNGKPSLSQRIAIVEERQCTHEHAVASARKANRTVWLAVFSALVAVGIALWKTLVA